MDVMDMSTPTTRKANAAGLAVDTPRQSAKLASRDAPLAWHHWRGVRRYVNKLYG